MKKLFITVCSVAMMGICSLAQAQDTTSTDYNNQNTVEESKDEMQRDAEDAGKDLQQGAERTGDQIEQGAQSTDQELQKDADEMEKNFEGATIDKVGPNGEKLFMERGRYYYMDEDGKKVKVKKSEVRDKSDFR